MHKLVLISAASLSFIVGGAVYAQSDSAPTIPFNVLSPDSYQDTPPPTKIDNSEVPLSSLISRETVLASRTLPESARNLSLELITWGKYAQEGGGEVPDISLNRQVWVLKDEYPEYEHLRLGTIQDAQVTVVLDAETGEMLTSSFAGRPLEAVGPNRFNATLVVPFDSSP